MSDETNKASRDLVYYIRFSDPESTAEELVKALKQELDNAIAAERSECAKIADHTSAWCRSFSSEETAERIAAAIRARGET